MCVCVYVCITHITQRTTHITNAPHTHAHTRTHTLHTHACAHAHTHTRSCSRHMRSSSTCTGCISTVDTNSSIQTPTTQFSTHRSSTASTTPSVCATCLTTRASSSRSGTTCSGLCTQDAWRRATRADVPSVPACEVTSPLASPVFSRTLRSLLCMRVASRTSQSQTWRIITASARSFPPQRTHARMRERTHARAHAHAHTHNHTRTHQAGERSWEAYEKLRQPNYAPLLSAAFWLTGLEGQEHAQEHAQSPSEKHAQACDTLAPGSCQRSSRIKSPRPQAAAPPAEAPRTRQQRRHAPDSKPPCAA